MLGLFIWYLGIWLGNQMIEPTMPVTWNHRVLVFEEHGEKSYCIHEVHYDDDGSILGWTAFLEEKKNPVTTPYCTRRAYKTGSDAYRWVEGFGFNSIRHGMFMTILACGHPFCLRPH